jgi:hypothetical protein
MNWAVGWTGSDLNPWRNLQARPDRAFNVPMPLASKTCFPVALLVGRQSRRLQGQWLQNYFGLLRRTTNR